MWTGFDGHAKIGLLAGVSPNISHPRLHKFQNFSLARTSKERQGREVLRNYQVYPRFSRRIPEFMPRQ